MVAEGPSGVWDRTIGRLIARFRSSRDEGYDRLPMNAPRKEQKKETPSAVFAHYTVQVRIMS